MIAGQGFYQTPASGGGTYPGNPSGGAFTPTETASVNVTSSTFTEGRYTESYKVITMVGYVDFIVTGAGPTTLDFSLPVTADANELLGGYALVNGSGFVNELMPLIPISGTDGRISFTTLSGGNTSAFFTVIYKASA